MRRIWRKLAIAGLTLVVAALVIYASMRLVPGDPILALTAGKRLTPEQIEALRAEYGLDQGVVSGFLDWLRGAVTGNLGTSLVYQVPVTDVIASRLAVSGPLIIYGSLLTIVLGLGLALLAVSRGGWVDQMSVYVTGVASATPSFLTAIVLTSVFAVNLGWFPALGSGEGLADQIYHLTLPAIALSFATFGVMARLTRTAFNEQMSREHVEVAMSRGVAKRSVLRRHVVRNSLGPILTLVALLIATLFVGTAVVETAFGLDGVGSLLVESVSQRDLPVVQGITLVAVTLFVVSSTAVDLAQPLIDPRVGAER